MGCPFISFGVRSFGGSYRPSPPPKGPWRFRASGLGIREQSSAMGFLHNLALQRFGGVYDLYIPWTFKVRDTKL